MSQPRSSADSQVSSGVASRKSESTNTKLADGTWRRWSVRNSNMPVMPSAGPSRSGSACSASVMCRRPLVGGHQSTVPGRSCSRRPARPRDSATLASIRSRATSAASALRRNGIPGGQSDIPGRRSRQTTTRGASSARNSRTTNSSLARAAERRAEDAQSMRCGSSPGTYVREPAMSDPEPRRAPCIEPNASPIRRRRETSGKVRPPPIIPRPGGPGGRPRARRTAVARARGTRPRSHA